MSLNPAWGPIGEEVYKRTYSRTKPDGTKEDWQETVERVVNGNLALVDEKYIEPYEKEQLIEAITNFKIIPAGRHLWMSGVKGRSFLSNCFSGETKVLTRKGYRFIRDLVYENEGKHEVLTCNNRDKKGINHWKYDTIGEWKMARFHCYGTQQLYEVKFSDNTIVYATGDHNWYVTDRVNPIKTVDLLDHEVPFILQPKPEKNADYSTGLLHGFVFGDGSRTLHYSASVQMHGGKHENLEKLFETAGYTVTHPWYCDARVGRLPNEWKDLPNNKSDSYWYGFICGLIAADGTVDKKGSVYLYQADEDTLKTIRNKARLIGFSCNDLVLQRQKSPFDGSDAPLWRFCFRRFSITEDELILEKHKINFRNNPIKVYTTNVVSVKKTDRYEEIYCCIQPETHTFVIENNILTRNCHAAGWTKDIADHFTFLFDELMKGGGVGSNYSNKYIENYPLVKKFPSKVEFFCNKTHKDIEELKPYVKVYETDFDYCENCDGPAEWHGNTIEDSREGWCKALKWLIGTYFSLDGGTKFDISDIRPKGSEIKTFGGISSGPLPLVLMLKKVSEYLNERLGKKLTSLDFMQIDHLIAECVISGNVRRSARMSIKNWNDPDIMDFINCKSDSNNHWTTNISVEIDNDFFVALQDDDYIANDVLNAVCSGIHKNGEPGIWNSDLASDGELEHPFTANPCGEISFEQWENCNLGHVNLASAKYDDEKGYQELRNHFRLMTRFLVRATFGDYVNPLQKAVVKKNRRIGVGIFGLQQFLVKWGISFSSFGNGNYEKECFSFRDFYNSCREEANRYAFQLRIPSPIKVTTIAPTGTIANLPGVTSGCQPIFAKYYKRRVTYSNNDPNLKVLLEKGYEAELSVYSPNSTVVSFYCKDPLVKFCEDNKINTNLIEEQSEISLEDHLCVQSKLQDEYADNSISYTINFDPKKYSPEDISKTLIKYLPYLKGTTLMPENNSRPQMPFERITKEQYEEAERKGIAQVSDNDKGCGNQGCPIR